MFGRLHPQEMVRLQKYSVVMRIDRPKLAMMKMSQAQRIRISTMITLILSLSHIYILASATLQGLLGRIGELNASSVGFSRYSRSTLN